MATWSNSLVFCVLLSLCCCPPVGILLFWTNPDYGRDMKIVFTVVFVAWMLAAGSQTKVVNNYYPSGATKSGATTWKTSP